MVIVKTIDAQGLKKWMEQGEVILVDVRGADEYEEENIPGSFLIPLGMITRERLEAVFAKKTPSKVVIHCRSGARSHLACEKLIEERELGLPFEIYNLVGGIQAWSKAGFSTQKGEGA